MSFYKSSLQDKMSSGPNVVPKFYKKFDDSNRLLHIPYRRTHVGVSAVLEKQSHGLDVWPRHGQACARIGGFDEVFAEERAETQGIFCLACGLQLLQRDSQNLAALRGLGQMWLSRAQPSLARIHAGQSRAGSESATEAERRVGAAEYVEARGILQPAVEYLEKAVAAASKQSALAGDLLAKVGSRSDL